MTTNLTPPLETVRLAPSFRIPLGLAIASVPLVWFNVWLGLPIFLFSVFLGIQAATLRLEFTATDLDVYRGSTQIRQFPYRQWQHWQIFWTAVPILFYFREVNSIHFLPILFDPVQLLSCLQERCPRTLFVSNPNND
ncbi:DUF3119 family protein [Candidatus Synechococcus calcipolaris G9]|uniref:DUF3119 family protein n=1 Tax=Candidatus Synechococcus calcipolaris G9 TaxID=1497997 RepID=A0ABT6EXT3_9SYNE|nr:DUF3119 family protein [Candidatus Synechococcus calcipolaris]MDG2990609.1 DUF3119 family protein [Candidatus Synechococcus calcipolaris G9]